MTAQAGVTTSSSPVRKRALRAELRRRRAALTPAQRHRLAAQCARQLLASIRRQRIRRVALYLAYGSELSTTPLIRALAASGVQLLLPRLRGTQMQFVEWAPGEALRRNRFGIAEPCGRRLATLAHVDLVLMPLTGYDRHGRRLGTGGGYYDRALEHLRERHRPWRVGYAYSLQACDDLPDEPWDVRLHAICTERGLLRFAP